MGKQPLESKARAEHDYDWVLQIDCERHDKLNNHNVPPYYRKCHQVGTILSQRIFTAWTFPRSQDNIKVINIGFNAIEKVIVDIIANIVNVLGEMSVSLNRLNSSPFEHN